MVMHACMYVCMYVRTYVCLYVCMHVRVYASTLCSVALITCCSNRNEQRTSAAELLR